MKLKEYLGCIKPMWEQRAFWSSSSQASERYDDVVVSLTSFSKRYHALPYVVASILNQTIAPRQVYVWIQKGETHLLPKELFRLEEKGLVIQEVEHLGSYSKLIHAIEILSDVNIVTADDDLIYAHDWLEGLVSEAKAGDYGVYAYCTREMKFSAPEVFASYKTWLRYPQDQLRTEKQMMPIGYGGVYYPRRAFGETVLDQSQFQKLAPRADDIWFKAQTLLNGVDSYQIPKSFGKEVYLPFTQGSGLKKINVRLKGNEEQAQAVFEALQLFGQLRV